MNKEQIGLVKGLRETKGDYEFADLSPGELDRLKEVEQQLGRIAEENRPAGLRKA